MDVVILPSEMVAADPSLRASDVDFRTLDMNALDRLGVFGNSFPVARQVVRWRGVDTAAGNRTRLVWVCSDYMGSAVTVETPYLPRQELVYFQFVVYDDDGKRNTFQ
jgi:hypothetical protein